MNRRLLFSGIAIFAAAFSLFGAPSAQAYTSADYYNAGLQLYNAQNYAQAIQYFSAAIQVDPNNAAALQGRANCYYATGQYQQALDDYQKVQAISPNPQLASMIQALQAKLGSSPAAPPAAPGQSTAAPPAPGQAAPPLAPGVPGGEDPFAQGTALFQQKQYAQAIPLFQQAVQQNPRNANAYYYLGACQLQTGDLKDAAVALGVSSKLNPNPSVDNYVTQIKARLSPDDQQWVDGQITATSTAAAAGVSAPGSPKTFGIRFEPVLVLISPADFTAAAQAGEAYAKQYQTYDPNYSYSASVPSGYPNIQLEPVFKISPEFELGLPIALGLVGNYTVTSGDTGNTSSYTYALSAFSVGINARYLMSLGKDMKFFVAGGPLVVPMSISATSSAPSGSSSAPATTYNFSAVGFGGQLELGLDYQLSDSFVVGPIAGFQLASASGFTGTYSGQNAELYFYPATSSSSYAGITTGTPSTAPTGSRPLILDLSGPFFGIQLSAFF